MPPQTGYACRQRRFNIVERERRMWLNSKRVRIVSEAPRFDAAVSGRAKANTCMAFEISRRRRLAVSREISWRTDHDRAVSRKRPSKQLRIRQAPGSNHGVIAFLRDFHDAIAEVDIEFDVGKTSPKLGHERQQ